MMKLDPTISDLPSLVVILLVVGGYYLYYFIAYSHLPDRILKRISDSRMSESSRFLFRKVTGFFFLGLIPATVFYLISGTAFLGFRPDSSAIIPGLGIFTGLSALVITISAFSSRKKSVYRKIPQIRTEKWNRTTVLIAVTGWAIYLFAYEFLFRGIFLFSWVEYYGFWPAVGVNLAIYSAFHLPNGMDETLGALVFGFFLCLISLYTHTFLYAFLLHLVLAVSGELFAVHYNPDMDYDLGNTFLKPGKKGLKEKF